MILFFEASEIEYWKRRVQRLTNLAEQIKSPKCLEVVRVVVMYSKETDVDQKRKVNMLPSELLAIIRRWKSMDIAITECINESMDNEKYLKTLDKFIDPLNNPDPNIITEILPALMNSIKMIYTIVAGPCYRSILIFGVTFGHQSSDCTTTKCKKGNF